MEVDHNKDGELQFGEFCLFIKKIKEGGIHGGGYQEALATQARDLPSYPHHITPYISVT